MDSERFDALARSLTSRGSRRGALRWLAGSALAVLTGAAAPSALAKQRSKRRSNCPKKPCPRGKKRDPRTCKCECVRKRCSDGKLFNVDKCKCTCPPGTRECGKRCISTNACCAGADEACPEDPRGCCHSHRAEECTIDGCCSLATHEVCNGFCVDTQTDRNHCGRCNHKCRGTDRCVDGKCKLAPCPEERQCEGVCCRSGETCSVDGKCEDRTKCPREVCTSRGLACCPPNSWSDSAYCRPPECACIDNFVGYKCP